MQVTPFPSPTSALPTAALPHAASAPATSPFAATPPPIPTRSAAIAPLRIVDRGLYSGQCDARQGVARPWGGQERDGRGEFGKPPNTESDFPMI